jgi:hypothetical protein
VPDDPFCNPFDALLAHEGPPAVFLRDPEGKLRFDAEWTRDAWGRLAVGERRWCWVLARDRSSGHVQLLLATSPDLVGEHPRLQFRHYDSAEQAIAALAAIGRPPVTRDAW